MKLMNLLIITMIVSSFILIATVSVKAVNIDITDPSGDVATEDLYSNITAITYSPYVTIANLDIKEITFTRNSNTAVLTLEVYGVIEGRGNMDDFSFQNPNMTAIDGIDYSLTLTSSNESYTVSYVNKSCQLMYSDETTINLAPSDFSVAGNRFTVSFPLKSSDESNFSLDSEVIYMKLSLPTGNEGDSEIYIIITDLAPNTPLSVDDITTNVFDTGLVEEKIQFNGSVSPLAGQPPYEYTWNFGDSSTPSHDTNPTHTYTKSGNYFYNFTVTDHSGASASSTGKIIINQEGGGGGGLSTQMILFLAVLLIIIIVGAIVIVMIIRRR